MLDITNLTRTKISTDFLQKVARAAFAVLGLKDDNVSLVLVGEKKIKELNEKYRGKNKVTDVLSFEDLDEIFICLPRAKRQAKLLKTPLKSELTRLFVHGIVHLKGYDHERSKTAELEMRKIEEKILARIWN